MYRVSATRPSGTRPRTNSPQRVPITALAKDYPAGAHVPRHHHQRGQVIHAVTGVAQITTREGTWILPPQRALWVPPRMPHEVRIESDLAVRTLYLDRESSAPLGPHCKVLFVSTLLRELVLEVVRAYERRDRSERSQLLTRLVLCELQRAERSEIHIPAPSDARLRHVCRQVLDDPSRRVSLDLLAYDAGASSRTLARLFEREVKMTFVKWRQHVRLARALSQIAIGDPMKKVARDSGYRSCSAFSAMFRQALGSAPTRYLQQPSPSAGPAAPTSSR
jgi:AraC-like DNA-binding protein/mannose-6-phosphate isomerase-like protein (cupin superfamily)